MPDVAVVRLFFINICMRSSFTIEVQLWCSLIINNLPVKKPLHFLSVFFADKFIIINNQIAFVNSIVGDQLKTTFGNSS